MKKKYICIICIIVILAMGYKYYKVNANVANKYYLNKYNLNEVIKLKDASLKIQGMECKLGAEDSYNERTVDITCNVEFTNLNKEKIQDVLNELCYKSSLGIGMAPCQFNDVNKGSDEIKEEISRKGKSGIKIKYSFYGIDLNKLKNKDEIRFYISRTLYEEEIRTYYKDNKLYSKYVTLGLVEDL